MRPMNWFGGAEKVGGLGCERGTRQRTGVGEGEEWKTEREMGSRGRE